MLLSFEVGDTCPGHSYSRRITGTDTSKRIIKVIDLCNRRIMCGHDPKLFTANDAWHFFDEIKYITGKNINFVPEASNEYGEICP